MLISPMNSGGYSPTAASAPIQAPATQLPGSSPSIQPSTPVELPSQAVQPVASLEVDHIRDAVEQINKVVQTMTNDVRFTVDEDTGIHVVKVVDTNSQEVIRQFPSKDIIDLAKTLDKLRGLIIRQTA